LGKPQTFTALLARGRDDASAITAPGMAALSYGALRSLIGRTGAALADQGVGRRDCVVMVLPNGPLAATTFLAISSHAIAAPLNPAYGREEFEFFLADLNARLVIVANGESSGVRQAAEKLGIAVAEIVAVKNSPAGVFEFKDRTSQGQVTPPPALEPDDIALYLHTSGTTSRPKLVPLSHRNLCLSAANIADTLGLCESDHCLNIMPLFHIHGLVAALLASLFGRASVCCSDGFNGLKFFSLMDEMLPTWFTAVPTMHQMILDRAAHNKDVISRHSLRFMRSSSAALPPHVLSDMEAAFGVPMIEAYGMTEAAHQMTSNPLPPGERKPGTVGRAAGPEMTILDQTGKTLGPNLPGEVAIRGANVTKGYANNAAANTQAFTDGWFRTGDQGMVDDDGYLTITGRLKEIINRGGEKISPREVDEVLLKHPLVAQAVTFAMPHDKLGEEVAAAIVLVDGVGGEAEVGGDIESDLRKFAGAHLAPFKVPRRIVIVAEIPKGPTGKLQRIGLASKLGLKS